MFSSYSEHDYDIRSIYFGGGTPSFITDNNLTAIFETLDLHFDLSNVEQISIEATTVSINEEQVKRLQKFGTYLAHTIKNSQTFWGESHLGTCPKKDKIPGRKNLSGIGFA